MEVMMGKTEIAKYPPDIPPIIVATIVAIHSAVHRAYLKLSADLLSVLHAIENFYEGDWDLIGLDQ